MARAYIMLAGLAMLWLFGVACGIVSVALNRRGVSRSPKKPMVLAGLALMIGVAGLWPPIASWPRLYYTFSSGDSQYAIDSTWFFAAPLIAGIVALAFGCRRSGRKEAS